MTEEELDARLRAARRAKEVVRPCHHCYAIPEIIARDQYGYPKATGWTHEKDCPDYVPDFPAA